MSQIGSMQNIDGRDVLMVDSVPRIHFPYMFVSEYFTKDKNRK
ncbi:MAG TPA: hypothetical protein PLT82_09560 [Candidatus Hydrogenedens sp.]|nr:hypothetical protein [Candidatus Hydrogenedens sp.]HOL19530.1 hypothetical protein [Candidatus Hydrogenedens sp.]HPP59366.1 hypothetical protein [Candidatus Hydrogenedens sp.]